MTLEPYYRDTMATVYHGDALGIMPALPAKLAHCCVTSPPYFALRSYLDDDDPLKAKEIGSEPTPEEFIATMVQVFREVRRVMRDDGVLFLNLGDSYGGSSQTGGTASIQGPREAAMFKAPPTTGPSGQLLNIPHRVAEALRADGWIWRQTICWHKKSPMPESVKGVRWERCRVKVAAGTVSKKGNQTGRISDGTDYVNCPTAQWAPCPGCLKCEPNDGWVLRRGKGRCTTAHEYVFIMTKGPGYFWDSAGAMEEGKTTPHARGGTHEALGGPMDRGGHSQYDAAEQDRTWGETIGRNPRSVWSLSTEPTSIKHFATFPSELVRRCLSAGVSAKGCCPHCGAPWAPMIDVASGGTIGQSWHDHAADETTGNMKTGASVGYECGTTLGYRPTCDCPEHEPIGSLVFDPFAGIGTVGQTAIKLGNRFLGIDLNEKYLKVAVKRMFEAPRWWLRQQNGKPTVKPLAGQRELF